MRRLLYLIILLIFFIALSAGMRSTTAPAYVEDEVLVRFKPTTSAKAVSVLTAAVEARVLSFSPSLTMHRLKLTGGMGVEEAVAHLRAQDQVELAEPNYRIRAFATPNDPSFSKLWGLSNTGQTGGLADADIDAPEAWSTTTGS
ncbi:MAG TPA: hypothetical protein PKJ13_08400, partial [bacterium]|nr:hypothetical protein [bacterium]